MGSCKEVMVSEGAVKPGQYSTSHEGNLAQLAD